jgi:hypothetical protein
MIKRLLRNGYKHFFFDLDGTIWNCYDKYQNPIWGKQMISPYQLGKGTPDNLSDDVGSICYLQSGIREVLSELSEQQVHIGICSASKNMNFEYTNQQPCIQLLRAFGLWNYFSPPNFLEYKKVDKASLLSRLYDDDIPLVLFDDNREIIEACMKTPNIFPIGRYNFINWREMLS